MLHHDPHILLIPGTASVAHLEENMAVSGVHLDPATAATMDTLAPATRLP
jgi:aryl-alcohol dehydrogenase-like predicted oxidoreductase